MNELFEKLIRLEPTHFRWHRGRVSWLEWRPSPESVWICTFDPPQWEMAGWMLEQMQERRQEMDDRLGHDLVFRRTGAAEIEALRPMWSQPLSTLTPEVILRAYVKWKESVGIGAEAPRKERMCELAEENARLREALDWACRGVKAVSLDMGGNHAMLFQARFNEKDAHPFAAYARAYIAAKGPGNASVIPAKQDAEAK